MLKEANYPPKGEYYMYPCYDEDGELVKFSTDYEEDGAYGSLQKISVGSEDKTLTNACKFLRISLEQINKKYNLDLDVDNYVMNLKYMVEDNK